MPGIGDNFLLEPAPNDEAARWIAGKPVVSREVFQAMIPEVRARAWLVTGIEDANASAEIRDIVAKLPEGESWESLKKQLATKLGPWLSSDDGSDAAAVARAELLLRTHGFQAYTVAENRVMRRQQDVFPFWQYLSLEDEKVRPAHAALHEKIVPAGSPFWNDHTPPWQWGCRCRKAALLEDEAVEAQAEDDALPPEKRRVMEGPGLKLLEGGRMYDPQGRQISIKSDAQKGKAGFYFDPDSLRLPLDTLKDRYDATTWGEFETAMKAGRLEDGRTVWAWLNGAKAGGKAAKTTAAAVAAAPVASTSTTTAAGTPLAGKLDVAKLSKPEQKRVNGVLALIDQVHGDGVLKSIPVHHRPGRGNLGAFRHRPGGEAVGISYKKGKASVLHPELTLVHEIGHWLDHSGMPGQYLLTSAVPNGPLADVMQAALDSDAVKAIQARPPGSARSYYLKKVEIFARAYAQFIAEETQDPMLLSQIATIRGEGWPERQWDAKDFAPIRTALREAFVKQGWMKNTAP